MEFPGNESTEMTWKQSIRAAKKRGESEHVSGKGRRLLECLSYRRQGHSVFTRDEIRPRGRNGSLESSGSD